MLICPGAQAVSGLEMPTPLITPLGCCESLGWRGPTSGLQPQCEAGGFAEFVAQHQLGAGTGAARAVAVGQF